MASRWTHNICLKCWEERNPERHPVRAVTIEEPKQCCFCGMSNSDGIFVRHDPETLWCSGEHE